MRPSELDFSDDVRRYWWVVPPALIVVVVLIALELFDGGSRPLELNESHSQRFFTGPAPRIDIENEAGSVVVRAHDGLGVVAVVERLGRGADFDEAFDALANREVRVLQLDGDTVRVVARAAEPAVPLAGEARLVLSVPREARLNIHQGAGAILVEGVRGDITATTGAGGIRVVLPRGSGFRLGGSGDLQSDFPLEVRADGRDQLFVTKGAAPQQELRLYARRDTVEIVAD